MFRLIVKATFAIDNAEMLKMMAEDGYTKYTYRRSDVMAKILDGEPNEYAKHITEFNVEQIYFSDEVSED